MVLEMALPDTLFLRRFPDELSCSGFGSLGSGVYVGLSRKAMIGTLTGRIEPADRAAGSAVAALIAVQRGARMVRVHDVAATMDTLAVWHAVHAVDAVPRRDDKPAMPRWPDDE